MGWMETAPKNRQNFGLFFIASCSLFVSPPPATRERQKERPILNIFPLFALPCSVHVWAQPLSQHELPLVVERTERSQKKNTTPGRNKDVSCRKVSLSPPHVFLRTSLSPEMLPCTNRYRCAYNHNATLTLPCRIHSKYAG